ncbi:MAG: hypothetical protein ACYS0I_06445 [Planctomycetota bacterium]
MCAALRGQARPDDIDAIAVANQPGLTVALVVGVTAAKALCFVWEKPHLRMA